MAARLRSDQLDQLLAALSQTIELYSGRKGVAKMRGRGAGTGWGGLREQRRGIREGGREKRKSGRKKYVGEGAWKGPHPLIKILDPPLVTFDTAHQSTASEPTSYYSMWHYNYLRTLKD